MPRASKERYQAKIDHIKEKILTSSDKDQLYQIAVVIVGPSSFAGIVKSNSAKLWTRIEKPGTFTYDEIQAYAKHLQISVAAFLEVLDKQKEHNISELKKGRLIGKKKYQPETRLRQVAKAEVAAKSQNAIKSIGKKTARKSK